MELMANEAVLKVRLEDPIDFTCADGTGIEKGTICALTDPRTAIAVSSTAQVLAGITAREKIASDGRTQIACFRKGIFDLNCSGAVNVGDAVSACASNEIKQVANGASGATILGYALEAGSDNETIEVLVDITAGAGN